MCRASILRAAILAIVSSCAASFVTPARADDTKTVNVQPGDLTQALETLAKQCGVNVIYTSDQLRGLKTRGFTGSLTAREAVDKLLRGTALRVSVDETTGAMMIFAKNEQTPPTAKVSGTESALRLAAADAAPALQSQSTEKERPGSAFASSESDGKVQEIIVSAQRRDERLIDTPISIGVLTGEALDRGSSRGVSDVLNQVGGVSLIETQPGNVQIAVRGVLSGAGTSTIGYYMDEVPFALINFANMPDTDAFDLARIEVLRGPQGTLYGVNALGGVVRMLTNDANLNTFEAKGRVRTSSTEEGGGNYGGDLAVNVPLMPGKLAVRGVVGYSDLSGFIDSSNAFGLPGGRQRRVNDSTAQSYRLKINYQATDSLSAKLGYTRSVIDSGAPSQALKDLLTPMSFNQPDERVLDMVNLIAEYGGSSVSALSSTGYLDYRQRGRNEILLGGVIPLNFLAEQPLESFSQEVRLNSRLSGPWQWSAGAMYKNSTEKLLQDASPLLPSPLKLTYRSKSYALFGEGTRTFGGGPYELTAGLRYFDDSVHLKQYSNFFPGPLVPPTTKSFGKPTGRVVFARKSQDRAMFYGSIATGFRSGLHQVPSALLADSSLPAVDPDSLVTYEVGTKGRLFEGAIGYETAVYYTDWKDIQQSVVVPIGVLGFLNAGRASGIGADASVTYQPSRDFLLQVSVGWNDLQFDENVFELGAVLFAKDARLNDSPKWTGSINGDYRTATGMSDVSFVLSGNFAYGSPRLNRFLTAGALNQRLSDDLRALKASVGFEGGRWSVSVFGDNLLNDDGAVTSPSASLAEIAVRQRPRTIGLQMTFNY